MSTFKYEDPYKWTLKESLSQTMCDDWRTWIYERHPDLFDKFKHGDWVKPATASYPPSILRVEKYYENLDGKHVFNASESYSILAKDTFGYPEYPYKFGLFKKAESEYIKEILTAVARKKGIIEGQPFFSADNDLCTESIFTPCYDIVSNELWFSYGIVYRDGKWGKSIEEALESINKAENE